MKRTIFIFFNTLVWTLLLTASQCPPDTNAKTNAKKSTHLVVPDVTTIAAGKYQNKGYTSIAFAGKKLKTIGENAFKGNKITTLTLPESLTHIEDGAFEDNDIETLVLPKLTKLGTNAFKGNKLKEVTLREIIATFDKSAFANRKNFSLSLPIFKVPTVEVMKWIVSKFTTTTADGKKSITIIVKTTDEQSLKQADIDKHVKKAKEVKEDDAGEDKKDAAGEDKEDDAGAGEDKKDAAGEDKKDDADAGEEEGAGEDKKDAAGEDKEDDAGAGEADKKEDVSKYEEGDTKVEEIAINTIGITKFYYSRTKETGAVLHRVRRKGAIDHAKPLPKNEEAIYFLTNEYANENRSYYLYKKGDNIRITLTFNNEVHTKKAEVEKLKSNVCDGKPYLELKFLTNKDTRQACLTSASSTLNKKLEFWYEVKDGDNEHKSGIELVGSIIKQHTSIKYKNDKNVSKFFDGVESFSKTQQTLYKTIVETKKPNVPPIKSRVRICKKDEKDKCSAAKIFGINEIIEVRVLFNKNDIQALPEPTEDIGNKANPSFTLHIGDKTITAYYVIKQIPEETYEADNYSDKKKKPKMIFRTSPKTDGVNPEGAISIAEDSFKLSDATLKDIANRNINTTLTAKKTNYKVVDKTKFYTRKIHDPRRRGCIEVEERLPDDGVKIADDDECKIKVEETP